MDSKRAITDTFSGRASSYDSESDWVSSAGLIRPMVPDAVFGRGDALDMCSGTGVIGSALEENGWVVTCADLSPAMLDKCHLERKVVADLQKLPFADASFDLTTLRQGLQYGDLRQSIRELIRVTRSEIRLGHITMIDVEDIDWWVEYFRLASPGRRTVFCPGQIEMLCQQAGLDVVNVKVKYSRDSLLGPIMHLDDKSRMQICSTWRDAPSWFVQRYTLEQKADGDVVYAHRWEFIVARLR